MKCFKGQGAGKTGTWLAEEHALCATHLKWQAVLRQSSPFRGQQGPGNEKLGTGLLAMLLQSESRHCNSFSSRRQGRQNEIEERDQMTLSLET